VVIHWPNLSDKCIIVGRSISRYVIIVDGEQVKSNKRVDWIIILAEEINQLLRKCVLRMCNVRCDVTCLLFEVPCCIGSANADWRLEMTLLYF
jgi:hypothetical protein